MKSQVGYMVRSFLVLCFAISFAACATTPKSTVMSPADSETALRSRVTEYNNAKVAGDWEHVYSYYDASFKEYMSKSAFVNSPRQAKTKAFTIEQITISPSGTEADVTLKIDTEVRGAVFKGVPQKQIWIVENGVWVNFQQLKAKQPAVKE